MAAALIGVDGPYLRESSNTEQLLFRLGGLGHTRCVGRGTGTGFRIPGDLGVSEKHFLIRRHPDGDWEIQDCGSTNGTRVVGAVTVELKGSPDWHRLANRDEIHVGASVLMFVDDEIPTDEARRIHGLRSPGSTVMPVAYGPTQVRHKPEPE